MTAKKATPANITPIEQPKASGYSRTRDRFAALADRAPELVQQERELTRAVCNAERLRRKDRNDATEKAVRDLTATRKAVRLQLAAIEAGELTEDEVRVATKRAATPGPAKRTAARKAASK